MSMCKITNKKKKLRFNPLSTARLSFFFYTRWPAEWGSATGQHCQSCRTRFHRFSNPTLALSWPVAKPDFLKPIRQPDSSAQPAGCRTQFPMIFIIKKKKKKKF